MARPLPLAAASPRGFYTVETWGCQMNVHDSEKMAGALRGLGLAPTGDPRRADVILLNTCAVRDKATQKVFAALGRLRRLKRRNPRLVIGVTGCVAQLEGSEIFERAPFVDLVLGPRGISALPELLARAREGRAIQLEPLEASLTPPFESTARAEGVKAYVTVMEGCNKRCTFCIVPRTRGREDSRPLRHILQEVEFLAGRGFREVELLGQNVNAYRFGDTDFAGLLRAVDRVPGLERVRFTTSHPLHFSDAIIGAVAAGERICPSIHLPPQSGSTRVLRRMRRGYTREGYLERVRRLRRAVPSCTLSADIIVGFPGETDDDFEQTMTLLEEVRYAKVFSFVFSPRPDTPAAQMADDTPPEVNRERLARLQARQLEIQAEIHAGQVGARLPVLIEGPAKSGDGVFVGRSPEGFIVHFPGHDGMRGRTLPVTIGSVTAQALYGEVTPGPLRPEREFLDFSQGGR
ncbi:MAG: tRNA (N6-isopentenyl adenosine(37)-C2)-methylthiotransferase MiaB [Acidobacteriota bacterium]